MSDIECSVASRLVETPMVNACDNHHTDLGLSGTVKNLSLMQVCALAGILQ